MGFQKADVEPGCNWIESVMFSNEVGMTRISTTVSDHRRVTLHAYTAALIFLAGGNNERGTIGTWLRGCDQVRL